MPLYIMPYPLIITKGRIFSPIRIPRILPPTVEEQRTQIGTMKALGYGKYAIASKYLLYAFLATVGGSILGILIGEKILPLVIINGYGIMYKGMMNNIQIRYEFKFAMIAAGAATVCTVGATIFSCYRALAETPASLMRPPAPKEEIGRAHV